jgi:hypothetical protein
VFVDVAVDVAVGVDVAVAVAAVAVDVVANASQFKEWLCLRMQVSSRNATTRSIELKISTHLRVHMTRSPSECDVLQVSETLHAARSASFTCIGVSGTPVSIVGCLRARGERRQRLASCR